jgi:hypothetical protein
MSRKQSGKRGPGKEPSEAAPAPARGSNRRRWILRLAALLVAGIAALLWATQQRAARGIVIDNESGATISSLEVTVAGKTTTLGDLPSGRKATAPFGTSGDESFVFDGKLRGGKLHGGGPKAVEGLTLVIQPDGNVVFRQPGK